MKKWKGSLLLAICLLAMTSSMTVCAAGETILKGVSIDKLDVSGMTREEALAALESYEKAPHRKGRRRFPSWEDWRQCDRSKAV